MESISLDDTIRRLYDDQVAFIRDKNIELEREYFTKISASIPMGEMMQGSSFDDHFLAFKRLVRDGSDNLLGKTFVLLQDYFLFSYGHDMMFKRKLKADIYVSVPIEALIYPKLVDAVKERYTDISVLRENPDFGANMEGIDRIVYTYTEVQSLLYLLYCNNFGFPEGWEGIFPDTHEDVLRILKSSGMTIGDFLHALIDFKCGIMCDIFGEVSDPKLRRKYLEKVEALRREKHEETQTFSHVGLPITYFLDHTFLDFLEMMEQKPNLSQDGSFPDGGSKIMLPKDFQC